MSRNIYILGDSISVIGGAWSYNLASYIECDSVYILARGGATWGNRKDYQAYDKKSFIWNKPFQFDTYLNHTEGYPNNHNCFYNVPVDCACNNQISNQIVFMRRLIKEYNRPIPDVIIISCGINDTNSETVLYSDELKREILNKKEYTYKELEVIEYGIPYNLRTLKKEYPNAHIILLTPIPSNYSFLRPYIKNTTKWIEEYAKDFNCSLVDGYSCGINPDLEKGDKDLAYRPENMGPYLYDGLHPNEEGNLLLSKYFAKEIEEILKNIV